ncbi:MAG: toxin-antitoxin system YwqK family antitoxin [Bacteroidia bacterium]
MSGKISFNIFAILVALHFIVGTQSAFSQPGYTPKLDTLIVKKGNLETITIKNNQGKTIEIIRLKNGKRNGAHKVYSPQGILLLEENFIDSYLHGDFKSYEHNGKLVEKKKYVYLPDSSKSYLHGEHIVYSNGILSEKSHYHLGRLHGKFQEYYPSGLLKTKVKYEYGLIVGEKSQYNADGKLQYIFHYSIKEVNGNKVSVKNGIHQSYNNNGSLASHIQFKDDKKEGKCLEYHATGVLRKSTVYKEDKLHGEMQDYYENGTMERSAIYYELIQLGDTTLRNVYDGEKIQYYKSGMIQSKEKYLMGQKTGTWERFYESSGLLQEKTSYENNLKTGPSLYFDNTGNKTSESNYFILKTDSGNFSMKQGPEKAWKNNVLTMETQFRNDKEDGTRTSYYNNGTIASTMQLKNGLPQEANIEYFENGKIKSSRTYHSYYDYSNNPKYNSVGWYLQYDTTGYLNNKVYFDTAGQVIQTILYKNNRIIKLEVEKSFGFNYSPTQNITSLLFKNSFHQESLGLYYFQNGRIRRINFQNPETFDNSIIDISDDGKYYRTTSSRHEGPENLKPGETICKSIRAIIGDQLVSSPLFTDSILTGQYTLNYSNGKPLCVLQFKDDLLTGSFIVYDPIQGDTMVYRNYKEGIPNGYYVEKFAGKNAVHRGSTPDSTGLGWEEFHQPNGTPTNKKTFLKTPGQTIENREYFENGMLKSITNHKKKTYTYYDTEGKITSQTVSINDSLNRYSEFYSGTKKIKTERFYLNQKLDSTSTNFHQNGSKSASMHYRENKRNGRNEMYDEKGDTTYSANFIDDKIEGWVIDRRNGKVEFLYYENDKLVVQKPNKACGCIDTTYASNRIKFAPSVSSLIEYPKLLNHKAPWIMFTDSLNYKSIFYTGLQTSSGNNSGFASLNLMLYKEFAFNIPADEQLKIILNPCRTKGYLSRIETTVQYGIKPENTDVTFNPKRIAISFLKGPIKSNSSDYPHFTLYYNVSDVTYNFERRITIRPDKTAGYCFTPAVIKDYLQLTVDEGEPVLFRNSNNINAGILSNKNIIRNDELEKFFGIIAGNGIAQFIYKDKDNSFLIKGNTSKTFLGGQYACGNIHIACSKTDANNYSIANGTTTFNTDALVNLFNKYGFSRVTTEFDPIKNILTLYYFAE